MVDGLAFALGNELQYSFCQLPDGEFNWVAQVDGPGKTVFIVHHPHHPFDEVIHVLETARLCAVPVNGNVLILQGLYDKIGYHPAIVRVHVWPVGIEYPDNTDVQFMLAIVVKKKCFCAPLAFVIT